MNILCICGSKMKSIPTQLEYCCVIPGASRKKKGGQNADLVLLFCFFLLLSFPVLITPEYSLPNTTRFVDAFLTRAYHTTCDRPCHVSDA